MDVVNYRPLGGCLVDGQLIGYHGTQDTDAKTFVYKPAQNEIEWCARNVFNEHLPKGRLWEAFGVKGTNDYALSQSCGDMMAIVLAYFEYLRKELNIDTTADLISEWEESVGIPDQCTMANFQSLEERRELVKIHLSKNQTVTNGDFERMIKALTGFDAIVLSRHDSHNLLNGALDGYADFDAAQLSSDKADRFIFDIFIDYQTDIFFGGEFMLDGEYLLDGKLTPRIVECVVEKLKPSNSIAIYHYSSTIYNKVKGII